MRAEAHLRIGRLLAAYISPEKREEAIFEIVNQLNRGSHLITSAEEREGLAELNLIAGRRAKISTSYTSALSYLAAGRALLTQESWDNDYELIFSIEYLMAECELLTAGMVAAENRLSMLSQRAKARTISLSSHVCASRSTRPWIVAIAPWRYALNTCGAAALTGRRVRPAMKHGANTIEFGPSLEAGRSRTSLTCL